MEVIIQNHGAIAAVIAHIFLGLLFIFQGYDAVFDVKVQNIIEACKISFSHKAIPPFLTTGVSRFTSYVELIEGFLLIIGLFQYALLYPLGIDLIIVSIAFGIASPMRDTRYVLPRLILIIFLPLVPVVWNTYSLDNLFFNS